MIKFVIEIKNRAFILFLSWLSIFFVFYYYKFVCILLIVFSNYNFSNQILNYFIFTSVQELFVVYLNLCLFLTQYSFYFIFFYHFICYFSWGLFKSEYILLKKYFFLSFFAGVWSLFFFEIILLPAMLNFFLSFQASMPIDLFFEAKLSEFLVFCKTSFKSCFFAFQICAIVVLLTSYLNFASNSLKKVRKLLYLILLVFSTILTPPDVYSQLVSFFLFIFCLEFFVFSKFLQNNLNSI